MTQLSNCCKAQVIVYSSYEGTGRFICVGCSKACDLFYDEQASVDNKSHCAQCHIIDQHIKKHLEYNPCKITANFIYTAEVERLKRMENNIKRMIKDLDGMLSQEMAACGETKLMSNIKELLEALLK
jgi:hypothetical protein